MELGPALHIERDGDALIIRAGRRRFDKWRGPVLLGCGIYAVLIPLAMIGNPFTFAGLKYWPKSSAYFGRVYLGILVLAFFVACGLFIIRWGVRFILPVVFTTTFDPRSMAVVYSRNFWNRAPETESYSFEEISGIILSTLDYGCYPSVTLKATSRRLYLVPGCSSSMAGYCSATAGEKLAEAIQAAAGLPVSRETVVPVVWE